jgi:hypothetical protein
VRAARAFAVGNGKRVYFWKHLLCGDLSFEARFPKLF